MLLHLDGIRSDIVATSRIRSHVLSSGQDNGTTIAFAHGNMSAATYFEELMLGMPAQFHCLAPDLRGYGDTQDLPIDATRGARDTADDLMALFEALDIKSAHLVGWSAGAGMMMQFALDYPATVASLTLIAPVSPYGFGGSTDLQGTPIASDFAGSGGGTVGSDTVEQIRLGDPHSNSPQAPRHLLRNYFVNPPFRHDREELLVRATLKQKLGDQRYPGDCLPSPHWPHVAPGKWGPINAVSPKYFNTSAIVDLPDKPPILWIRGDADVIISDNSLFDHATLSPSTHRPQPMVGQMREVLDRYEQSGGYVEEVVMDGIGHSPFLEDKNLFLSKFSQFLQTISPTSE